MAVGYVIGVIVLIIFLFILLMPKKWRNFQLRGGRERARREACRQGVTDDERARDVVALQSSVDMLRDRLRLAGKIVSDFRMTMTGCWMRI